MGSTPAHFNYGMDLLPTRDAAVCSLQKPLERKASLLAQFQGSRPGPFAKIGLSVGGDYPPLA